MKSPPIDRKTFYNEGHQFYLRHLSIDCVIFGFHNNQLKVLLLEWKEAKRWCLPGGFILKNEHIDDAAHRILRFRTGLDHIHLQQFHAFGDPDRERNKQALKKPQGVKADSWMMERFVTIGYWALVEFSRVVPMPDEFSSDCRWWSIRDVPDLILDHDEILDRAHLSLRQNLNDFPVGKDLLPAKFTMPDLQKLYETILRKKLDRRNFQKKILSSGILERLKERKTGGAHKAPFLYRFHPKKYKEAMKRGLGL